MTSIVEVTYPFAILNLKILMKYKVILSSRTDFKQGDLLYLRLGWVDFMWIDPEDPSLSVTHLPLGYNPTDFFSLEVEVSASFSRHSKSTN